MAPIIPSSLRLAAFAVIRVGGTYSGTGGLSLFKIHSGGSASRLPHDLTAVSRPPNDVSAKPARIDVSPKFAGAACEILVRRK